MTASTMLPPCDVPAPPADLLERLRRVAASRRLEAVVQTDGTRPALTAELLALGLPLLAVDPRPEVVRSLRHVLAGNPAANVVQGPPARTLADHRALLPAETLYVFGACGLGARGLADQIFQVPRGRSAIAAVVEPGSGPHAQVDLHDQLLRWSPDHHVEWHVARDGSLALLALPQPRVHVTFLIEKYTHGYGTSGPSINLDNLVATLAATGLATFDVVHYDQYFAEGREIPVDAIGKPPAADVHVLVATLHYHTRANPGVALLERAKATGSRLAMVWLDKKISRSTPDYYRVADVNVVLDGNDFELPNAWPIFTPKNPAFFTDPGLERDLDVVLVGEVRYLAQRKALVERLTHETRIPVQVIPTSAADTGRALSVADYARLYQRARIALALTKDSVRQLKGRVFEVLHCGAMLMCDANHHVGHYLRDGEDYVVFRDYEDLVAKARHYLANEQERQAIARTGHRRAKSHYGHDVFWRGLLARLGATASAHAVTGEGRR